MGRSGTQLWGPEEGGDGRSQEEAGTIQPDWLAPELLPVLFFGLFYFILFYLFYYFAREHCSSLVKPTQQLPSRGLFFRAQFNIQSGMSAALSQMKAFWPDGEGLSQLPCTVLFWFGKM